MEDYKLNQIFVARQPIFDIKKKVNAYELLFRSSLQSSKADFDDPDQASLSVIADGFSMATSLSSKKPFFINFPKNLILNESVLALPPEQCVVEILETVSVDKEILDACHNLKKNGYRLALDDYSGNPDFDSLLDIVDYVKVDVLSLSPSQLGKVVPSLKKYNTRLLAEKIEDIRLLNYCLKLGFELFQGFFFRRPLIISGRKLSTNEASRLRIFKELNNPDIEIKDLSRIIQNEAVLSYRFLKYINSAFWGFSNKISSINQAVAMQGLTNTKAWLRVNLLSDFNQTAVATEVTALAVQRARFFELAAESTQSAPLDSDSMFLVGLFSLLDTLLCMPMQEILFYTPVNDKIKNALCGADKTVSIWLDMATLLEEGNWDSLDEIYTDLAIDPVLMAKAYSQAQEWARKLVS